MTVTCLGGTIGKVEVLKIWAMEGHSNHVMALHTGKRDRGIDRIPNNRLSLAQHQTTGSEDGNTWGGAGTGMETGQCSYETLVEIASRNYQERQQDQRQQQQQLRYDYRQVIA